MIMLVVDDDRLNLVMVEKYLHQLYPDSLTLLCHNPLEVPDLLSRHDVDLLFLDIIMPGRNGMDVLADVRSDERYNDMPIIMLTSMTDMDHFNTCFDLGANDYVIKPIRIGEFQARLKAAVQIRGNMKLIREMYRQVKVQNSDLRRLNAQLKDAQFHMVQQEKLASIGELAAGIAHEINNPIGYVASNIQTLQSFFHHLREALTAHQLCMDELLADPLTPDVIRERILGIQELERTSRIPYILGELDDTLDDTLTGTARVTKIVKTLRNFARSGTEEEIAPCCVEEIVEEALLIVSNESKYNIDIHREMGGCREIFCNRGQIGQVILNLLVNSIQAIKGQDRSDRGNILIRSQQEAEGISLLLQDDGPGIPDSVKMRIFDPFFTTKEIGQGTGLGLSISHDIIVNKHQGEIWVDDNPGGGTRFHIRLPQKRSDSDG